MKYLYCILILWLIPCTCGAQINITPYVPNNLQNSYPDAAKIFENKLNNILSSHNIKSQLGQSRFILTGNWSNETKDIVGGTPVQIAYTLNINMHIGDGILGVKYTSESFRVKGVGSTEEKAYLSAIKNMDIHNAKLSEFIKKGYNNILSYYELNKEKLISEVQTLINKQDYEKAIYQLCLIPIECSYYIDVQKQLDVVYQYIIDDKANSIFTKAKSIWAASQTKESAQQALNLVSNVNPHATCYKDIQSFIENVREKVDSINEREYLNAQAKQEYEREMEKKRLEIYQEQSRRNAEIQSKAIDANQRLQSERISAAREIAMEYAKSAPKTLVYKVNNWY